MQVLSKKPNKTSSGSGNVPCAQRDRLRSLDRRSWDWWKCPGSGSTTRQLQRSVLHCHQQEHQKEDCPLVHRIYTSFIPLVIFNAQYISSTVFPAVILKEAPCIKIHRITLWVQGDLPLREIKLFSDGFLRIITILSVRTHSVILSQTKTFPHLWVFQKALFWIPELKSQIPPASVTVSSVLETL